MNSRELYSSIINLKVKCLHGGNRLYRSSKSMVITIIKSNKQRAAIVYLYCPAIGTSSVTAPRIGLKPWIYILLVSLSLPKKLYVWRVISGKSLVCNKLLVKPATSIKQTTKTPWASGLTKHMCLTMKSSSLYSCACRGLKLSTRIIRINPKPCLIFGCGSASIAVKLLK